MRLTLAVVLAAAGMGAQEAGQTPEPGKIEVSADHPRLFLRSARMRLLQRQRERESPRWRDLDMLVRGAAAFPEPGFAYALHYRIAGDEESGWKAIDWALGPGSDLRQLAFVFDWCQELLSAQQSQDLAARITARMEAAAADRSIGAVRSRALAAIAIYGHVPDAPQRALDSIAQVWWAKQVAPALQKGEISMRENGLELMELLHAFRDAANLDLREYCPSFFRTLPIERLMSYYPAAFQGPDNDYRVPSDAKSGEPDWRRAALWRAGDLALAAYDVIDTEAQTLQGWLMHDRFIMRGALGAPYEFLWANPYQPGLSYYNLKLAYHNPTTGALYLRSGWQDSASWLGCFDGKSVRFESGHPVPGEGAEGQPLRIGTAVVFFAASGAKLRASLSQGEGPVFLAGLAPRRKYRIEIEGSKTLALESDMGGIIEVDPPRGREFEIRIR